ncbi:MAG: hypothetical protein ACREO5_08560 [Candidatus Binatia bacterium]
MPFTIKQALEFNKYTTALSAAGFAYASTVASESAALSRTVKWLGTVAIVLFAASVLCGAFVIGRASKLSNAETERVNDLRMKTWGQAHALTLVLGLLLSSLLMINKIWNLF